MTDDSKDDDKEKLKKQIKALEDKIDNLQKPLPERHIEVLEENQKLFRDGVTTRLESMERTSKWFYKYFTFSALALIALGAISVTIYVNTTSKKVAQEVTEIAEKKVKITLEFNDWYSKGAGESLDGKYEKAINSFTNALDKAPDIDSKAYTYNYRGVSYLRLDENEKALSDFDESIKLKPNNPLPYHNRALVYFNLKDYNRVYKEYTEAIRLYNIDGKNVAALAFSIEVYKLFEKVKDEEEIKALINQKIQELGNRVLKHKKE